MRIWDKLKSIRLGGDDELGRDDLLREIESGIAALARHGPRGREVFPPAVTVRVTAAEGGLEALRGFIADPAFERELDARLRNRMVNPEALPFRRYEVTGADSSGIEVVEEATAIQGTFLVVGGDLDGARHPIELTRKEWRLGRGPWHQERTHDQRLPNDIVLAENIAWISRAAALIRRGGAFLEIEARQQGDFLYVTRRDGTQLRPAMTASGRLPLQLHDRVVFHDGGANRLELKVEPC